MEVIAYKEVAALVRSIFRRKLYQLKKLKILIIVLIERRNCQKIFTPQNAGVQTDFLFPTPQTIDLNTMKYNFDSDGFKNAGFLLVGENPFAVSDDGVLKQRIQTFFIDHKAYITSPGIHATQRCDYFDVLNQQRVQNGEPKLTSLECDELTDNSVSLIVSLDPDTNEPFIGIRADGDVPRAIKAKSILSLFFPDEMIRLI